MSSAGCLWFCRIFGITFDPAAAWTVDACLLAVPAVPAAGTSGCSSSSSTASDAAGGAAAAAGTLFLDIVKLEEQWIGDPAQAEKCVR